MRKAESTILVYHDIRLKLSDGEFSKFTDSDGLTSKRTFDQFDFISVELLNGQRWINDQIIAFFMQYLEHDKYAYASSKLLFVPPSITQLIKMCAEPENLRVFLEPLRVDNKELIFFPVNNNETVDAGGTHWSLLVFVRVEDMFYIFDSIRNQNKTATKKIYQVLKHGLNCHSAGYHEHASTQQINLYDCGIHLLANIDNICAHYLVEGIVQDVPLVPQSVITAKRQEILQLIEDLSAS